MPPRLVYSVNFAGGNLTPENDFNGWGAMRLGGTPVGAGDSASESSESSGLWLAVSRAAGSTAQLVARSVYVFPRSTPVVSPLLTASGPGRAASSTATVSRDFDPTAVDTLPLGTRLQLSLEFDQPTAFNDTVYPWAVALKLKATATEIDSSSEAIVAATCQFNRGSPNADVLDGVRVNTPDGEQRDQQKPLYGPPLDYRQFRSGCVSVFPPPRFVLEHSFCGVGAANASGATPLLGYSVGSARLSIGSRWDLRVYSHKGLSSSASIGALGASVVTQRGVGQFSARLRRFAVRLW